MTAAISNAVVGVMHDYTGRGPTRARTTIAPDMIVVTLRDCLTKAERTLAQHGRVVEIHTLRRAMQDAMRSDLIAAVETLTGRTVEALLSENLLDPDVGVQIYLIERADHNGAHPA